MASRGDADNYLAVVEAREPGTYVPPRSRNAHLARRAQVARAFVFVDPRSQALMKRVHALAPSDANILITGETGTGKELIARQIHEISERREGPFVAINGSAMPELLIDAELFGFEKGAFTGAAIGKIGWFEAANGGTLFLDEIGDLPLAVQVKLLRVLQEREIVRIGSRTVLPVNVRLVAATHVDLPAAIRAGRFREDLYYRIRVAQIALPPLRDRPGDILPLAEYFLQLYASRLRLSAISLSPEAARALLNHPWPGNIRELENAVHNALLECRGGPLQSDHLHLSPLSAPPYREQDPCDGATETLKQVMLELFGREVPGLHDLVNRTLLLTAFDVCGRNQVQAAQLLGISRNVLRTSLARLGVVPRRRPRRETSLQAASGVVADRVRGDAIARQNRK